MVLDQNTVPHCEHPRRCEDRSGHEDDCCGRDRVFKLHAAGCQFEPVRAFICGASLVVPGPRSFSKTTPFRVTTKVLAPDDWYSTGYAIKVTPPFFLPRPFASDAEFRGTTRK